MFPSIFVSHGSPALILMDNPTTRFYKKLAKKFEQPKYILIISAHWETQELKILSNDDPFLIYDFYNFPEKMYNQEYPTSNDITRVNQIVELLKKNNIKITKDDDRSGYDHGVWAPLKMIYPDANIPVIQISLPSTYSTKDYIKLGAVLHSLRKDTLIIGSGNMTHNLGEIDRFNQNAKPVESAVIFREWIVDKLKNGDIQSMVDYKTKAPYLKKNHPTLEHFTPILVNLGSSKDFIGKAYNDVYMNGNLSMTNIIFWN